jgi:chorismate-pyruvate lyase
LLSKQSDAGSCSSGSWINFSYLTRLRATSSEQSSAGRVLILHELLREVELVALWKVTPGEELRELLGMRPGERTYGRTALIHVDGEPAVELIEIVAPVQAA